MERPSVIPRILAASAISGKRVQNPAGEELGEIDELMVDLHSGQVAYAVLSFGGFLGMGNKLFAIPWGALALDTDETTFVLNVDKELLENAPGFDKEDWPDMADSRWGTDIHSYYGIRPYWE
jgi:hypothetical protein